MKQTQPHRAAKGNRAAAGGGMEEIMSVAFGAGIGIGIATGKASEAVARQPEAENKIMKMLLLGGALAEATAIYGFVVAILIVILLK